LNSYNQLIRISNAAVDQDFSFEKKIQWDVHSLCSELALWMFDNDAQPSSTSLVGIFSSLAFERLISSSLDAVSVDLCTNLRLLVELSAALYSGSGQTPYAGLQPHELWAIQAYVGKKLFQSLDIALNTALKQASFDNMKGLFLVVLATIIAVGYSRAWNGVIHVSVHLAGTPSSRLLILAKSYDFLQLPPYEYELARDQLLRVLAHHLIRIGKEVNIIKISETEKEKAENGMTEKRIIDEASCQWKRRAAFVWKEMPPHEVVGTTGHQSSRRLSEKNLQCRYHLSRSHPVTESCRPVGGFGTCVKDVNPWHFVHGPSPMDKLLVDIEQLSFEPRAQEAPSVIADFDLFPGGDFPCGGSSINGTTISTPQWGSEEGVEGFLCNCCRSACKYHEMSSQNVVCQACASPCPSEFLVDDPVFLQSVPSMISTMATNDVFFELPSWDAEGLAGVRETNGFSTTFGADDLSLSDPTLDHFGEITNGLCSVNLIV